MDLVRFGEYMKYVILSSVVISLFGCLEKEEKKEAQTLDPVVKAFAEDTKRLLKEIDKKEKNKDPFSLTTVADEAPGGGKKKFSLTPVADAGENRTITDLSLEMLWVKPGTFKMGEKGNQYQVTLTEGFYLGKYEVTQAEWEQVMGNNPSHFKGADKPVEKVSFNDVVEFCNKLTEIEKKAGRLPEGMSYQLPSEAQWEYACRAGTSTNYSWGDEIDVKLANYQESGLKKTTAVGSYRPNPWGFYDMHGNISEFCADWNGNWNYPTRSVTDPIGVDKGGTRVKRGGSWHLTGSGGSARRNYFYSPRLLNNDIGFRVSFQSSK